MENEKKIVIHVSAFLENNSGEYLFLRRSKSSSWAPLVFDLPGGKLEWGEHPLETLERELFEEIGQKASNLKFIDMQAVTNMVRGINYHVLKIYYSGKVSSDIILSEEHQEYIWLKLSESLKIPEINDDIKKFIKKWVPK